MSEGVDRRTSGTCPGLSGYEGRGIRVALVAFAVFTAGFPAEAKRVQRMSLERCIAIMEDARSRTEFNKTEEENAVGYAAEDSGEIGNPRAVGPLIGLLTHEKKYLRFRSAAAEALGKIGDARAIEPLALALGDPYEEVDVRKAAAQALGAIGGARAVVPLIHAVKDKGPLTRKLEAEYVRVAAAEALGQIGDPNAVGPLVDVIMAEDVPYRVRNAVEAALAKLGDAAESQLASALDGGSYSHRRHAAAMALARIGDTRAVEPLVDSLRYFAYGVQLDATVALGKLGDVRAVEPLILVLGRDDNLAEFAAKSLYQIDRKIQDKGAVISADMAQLRLRIRTSLWDWTMTHIGGFPCDWYLEHYPEGDKSDELRRLLKYDNILSSGGPQNTDTGMVEAGLDWPPDQATLTKIALSPAPPWLAVQMLTDQAVLIEIAESGRHSAYARETAIKRVTDQTVLTGIALREDNLAVRLAAAARVDDPETLRNRIAALPGPWRSELVMGHRMRPQYVYVVVESLLTLRQATLDPVLQTRASGLSVEASVGFPTQSYKPQYSFRGPYYSVTGISATMKVSLDGSDPVERTWRTEFPAQVAEGTFSLPVQIDLSSLLDELLDRLRLDASDCRTLLAADRPPQLRASAQRRLHSLELR